MKPLEVQTLQQLTQHEMMSHSLSNLKRLAPCPEVPVHSLNCLQAVGSWNHLSVAAAMQQKLLRRSMHKPVGRVMEQRLLKERMQNQMKYSGFSVEESGVLKCITHEGTTGRSANVNSPVGQEQACTFDEIPISPLSSVADSFVHVEL